MRNPKQLFIFLGIILLGLALTACGGQPAPSVEEDKTANLTEEARDCVECHATETHGIVADWDGSAHADE